MLPTPQDSRRPFADSPLRRAYAEVYCLALTLVFHEENNHARKAATILVVGAWASIEIGSAFGVAELPGAFNYLRLAVGVLIGRMWGIEINNFAGVEFTHINDRNDNDND